MVVGVEDEHILVCHLRERILWIDDRAHQLLVLQFGSGNCFLLELQRRLCQVRYCSCCRVELILVVTLVAVLSLVEWVMSDCGTLINRFASLTWN